MSENPQQPEIPRRRDVPSAGRSVGVRHIGKIIVASAITVVGAGALFVGCRETQEQRMERIEDEERKALLKQFAKLYDEIVDAKDMPEDVQLAELNENIEAFAIAYAYEEIGWAPEDIRNHPLLHTDPKVIVQNFRNREDLRNAVPWLCYEKLKEGICVAVTMYQRKEKAIPRVVQNDKGVPEIIGDR